jgi:hypothetical protein
VDAATWSVMELDIPILAASLLTLRPIFVKIIPRIFGAYSSKPPTDRPAGSGCASTLPQSGSGTTRSGSAWLRSNAAPASHSPTSVIRDFDSTEELQSDAGWLSQRSGADDLEYGLQGLGPWDGGHHGKSYTIGVSAGRAETFTATDAQHDDGFGGGIKATTMITQHVECGGSNKKRLRGAS